MRLTASPSARQVDLGLTVLRVIAGLIFAAHGGQKLFVYGFAGVAGAFGQMGIPMAGIAGPAVALVEFLGGLALIAGVLTRLASLGLGVTMLGALLFVHIGAGFFLPNGYEFVLALLGSVVTLMFTGAGRYSVDALLEARRAAPADAVRKPLKRAA
jgi:putative oxidoreductase